MSVIELEQVTFKYHEQEQPTLKGISLTIEQGEFVVIAGASGSGKSTLMRLLNGLAPHAFAGEVSGSLRLNGRDILAQDIFELSLQTGTVLQDSDAQFVGLTVGEDVAFALENDAVERSVLQEQVTKWAQVLGLNELLTQNPQALSGGQKQRVAIAGVLIDDSPVLLFDEPLASLDPQASQATLALLQKLRQQNPALTIIVIEHRLEDILAAGIDRLLILNAGEIVADTTPDLALREDVLRRNGLAEPLYMSWLRQAEVDLAAVADLSKPNLTAFKHQLNGVRQPVSASVLGDAVIEVRGLDFSYDRPLFHDLNVAIPRGEIVAIVGKNGSGKTTFNHLLTGFLTPTAGDILVDGQSILFLSIKERAEKIGYVLQNPNHMITQQTVFEEVASGLRLRDVDAEQIDLRVRETLRQLDLDGMRNWPISALSYGQKKRLTIASVLVLAPKVLILDEPTAGQDERHAAALLTALRRLQAAGTTIMIVTHDMNLLAKFATQALVLVDGQILAQLPPAELLADENLVAQANLRTTSIQRLAQALGLTDVAQINAAVKREVANGD